MSTFFAFLAGLVFGIGLLVSGMTDPGKVLGFLDLAGNWDPSLALVMVGSLGSRLPMMGVSTVMSGIFSTSTKSLNSILVRLYVNGWCTAIRRL